MFEGIHTRCHKCAYFGELQQIDRLRLNGFPDRSGTSPLISYGISYGLLTDLRTVFTDKKKNPQSLDKDAYTRFTYMRKLLGVLLESASVPQTKNRAESLNGRQDHALTKETGRKNINFLPAPPLIITLRFS